MNRFTELLTVLESDASNRSIEISGKRRETIVEALRIAAAMRGRRTAFLNRGVLPAIPHATDNEKRIVGKLVTDLLATPGVICLSINDGEAYPVKRSDNPSEIYPALSSTGEDYLIVHELGKSDRWVRLIWGNDVDVISDYHVSLEPYLAAANALANELDK